MGMLLVIFAITIGYATFIENDFDAITAKMLVYNARWFEVLMLLMIVNFSGMIFTKQLYRKSKLNILAIHLSLIIIIIGAALTRYMGFEGQMHIRQGQTTDRYSSSDTYFNVQLDNGSADKNISKRIWLSPVNKNLFSENIDFNNRSFQIEIERYIPNAVETLIANEQGTAILSLVTAGEKGRKNTNLKYGETKILNGIAVSFGDTSNQGSIHFMPKDRQLFMKSSVEVSATSMVKEKTKDSTLVIGEFLPVLSRQVFKFPGMNLMVKDFAENASISYIPDPNDDGHQHGISVAKLSIEDENISKDIFLKWGVWEQINIDGINMSFKFGRQDWVLPFSLRLNEFQLDRYPGSMSPSSFASEITLIDQKNNVEKPYRIFMNNILEYKGYRFYQSSYDKDEKGTILSVNHDYWGTVVTYFGYFLLFATLIVSFFTKKTRFSRVSQQIKEVHEQRKKLLASAVLILFTFLGGQYAIAQDDNGISKEHAASFGKLLTQKKEGRIVPVNTIANQVLMKIYKKSSFEGLTPDQVFLGMISNPQHWQHKPMIKVGDPALQSLLGIEGNYASINNFFNEKGEYVLKSQIADAYAKKPAIRNLFDKELIYVDERVNVSYMVFSGSLLKFFPIPNHPENNWVSPADPEKLMNKADADQISKMFTSYLEKLKTALQTNNYTEANEALDVIKNYQKKEGAAIIPSETKVNMEVFYNNTNIFKKLFPVYMLLGIVLFGFFFAQIFKPALQFKVIIKILIGILFFAFVAQTFGLGLRWYIADHAPWSNGYESMIYISWATILAGFMFMKKSPIILSVTALLSGVTLLTAHMSWMNPEITNLVPVLKSYWLTIHVATITASYGFLALGGMTGFLNLGIMIFRKKSNMERVNLTLKELTLIIELSLTVGLILLIIGNFLGGIWANESWGRYWGWDPKETWSLVTIIVYSFILHMRLVPGLRSTFSFNFLSMFGFSSVLMTYFGVNYYLSGLHSYASGDPIPVPNFVYYTLAIIAIISALASYNDYKRSVSRIG